MDAAEVLKEELPPLGPGEVYVESSDGKKFRGKRKFFSRISGLLKNFMEDCPEAPMYPIPNVTGEVFENFVQYYMIAGDPIEEDDEKPEEPKEISEQDAIKGSDKKPGKPKDNLEEHKENPEKPMETSEQDAIKKNVEKPKDKLEKPKEKTDKPKEKPDKPKEKPDKPKEITKQDADFLKGNQSMLLEIVLAANYLDAEDLLDLTCLHMANMMKE